MKNRILLLLPTICFLFTGHNTHAQTYPRIGYAGLLITNVVGATLLGSGGGGGGGGTNVPPSTSTLIHWWDFSDSNKVTASSSRIDSVADKGTSNLTMTASTTLRPWNTNTASGKTVATFLGAQGMSTASEALAFTNISIGVIAKVLGGGDQVLLENSVNYNNNDGAMVFYCTSLGYLNTAVKNGTVASFITSNFITSSTNCAMVMTYSGTLSLNEVTGYIDGTSVGTRTQNGDTYGTLGNYPWFMGSRNLATSLPLAGDIYEVLIWKGVLTAQDIADFEAYKNTKYQ